jgi:hypothetical protein
MGTSLKYDDMVHALVARVPAFSESAWGREVLTANRDLPYVVFGGFASFLNRLLLGAPSSDSTIQASFQLLNEMGNSADQRVVDLAAAGVFEVLTDSQQSIRVARQLLYGPAIDLFERMIQLWGVDVKDP